MVFIAIKTVMGFDTQSCFTKMGERFDGGENSLDSDNNFRLRGFKTSI